MKDYEAFGARIPDEIKMGVLQSNLSPVAIQQHLVTNAGTFTSYKQMKDFVEPYIIANSGVEEDAMDLSQLEHQRRRPQHKSKGIDKHHGKYGDRDRRWGTGG